MPTYCILILKDCMTVFNCCILNRTICVKDIVNQIFKGHLNFGQINFVCQN